MIIIINIVIVLYVEDGFLVKYEDIPSSDIHLIFQSNKLVK